MILDLIDRGWGAVTVEAVSGEHWLVIAANAIHQGNLIGDIRRWTRQYGYQFFVKHSGEEFKTPDENSFLLPDSRRIEFRTVLVRSSNFTQWGLGNAKTFDCRRPVPGDWSRYKRSFGAAPFTDGRERL